MTPSGLPRRPGNSGRSHPRVWETCDLPTVSRERAIRGVNSPWIGLPLTIGKAEAGAGLVSRLRWCASDGRAGRAEKWAARTALETALVRSALDGSGLLWVIGSRCGRTCSRCRRFCWRRIRRSDGVRLKCGEICGAGTGPMGMSGVCPGQFRLSESWRGDSNP